MSSMNFDIKISTITKNEINYTVKEEENYFLRIIDTKQIYETLHTWKYILLYVALRSWLGTIVCIKDHRLSARVFLKPVKPEYFTL